MKPDLRPLRRAIDDLGRAAARASWTDAVAVTLEAAVAYRALEKQPTSDAAFGLQERLETIATLPRRTELMRRGGAALDDSVGFFAVIAANEAEGVGADLGGIELYADAGHLCIETLDWTALDGQIAPPRDFVLPDWIPSQCVTLLHGSGGVGKSLLAQQIGTVAALHLTMLGGKASACPVLGWFGEDDHDELWRRQENINAQLGIHSMAALAGNLIWRPCPGDDITLFRATSEGDYATTPAFEHLRAQLRRTASRLVILDSAAQIAAVPEVSRTLVTRCLSALNSLCLEFETTILLLAHDNRTGDFSGSSAWENRVRSRMHIKRERDDAGNETTILSRPKANYATRENGVTLEWVAGAYRCHDQRFETAPEKLARKLREGEANQAFLAALDKLNAQRRAVSASRSAQNYAPRVMTASQMVNGFSKGDLEQAMLRLFNDERIVADAQLWQKTNRHWAAGIARKI